MLQGQKIILCEADPHSRSVAKLTDSDETVIYRSKLDIAEHPSYIRVDWGWRNSFCLTLLFLLLNSNSNTVQDRETKIFKQSFYIVWRFPSLKQSKVVV